MGGIYPLAVDGTVVSSTPKNERRAPDLVPPNDSRKHFANRWSAARVVGAPSSWGGGVARGGAAPPTPPARFAALFCESVISGIFQIFLKE